MIVSAFFRKRPLLALVLVALQFGFVTGCKSAQVPPWLEGAVNTYKPGTGNVLTDDTDDVRPQQLIIPETSGTERLVQTGGSSPAATGPQQTAQVFVDPTVIPETNDAPLIPPGPVLRPPEGVSSNPGLNGSSAGSISRSVLPPPTPALAQDKVRVAMLLPMSGPNAQLGEAMLNAAQLALFDFADDKFELVLHDTAGDPFFASDAAAKAVADNAGLIIGPLLGRSVRAIRPTVTSAGVPVIAFSSDRTIAGNGIYTMGFLPGAEVERVTDYALSRGLQRFAVMAPDSDYGRTVVEALALSLEIGGGELVRTLYYDPFADDYSAVVQDIADYEFRRQALLDQRAELAARDDDLAKEALENLENLQTIGDLPFDALMVADGGDRLVNIAALLPFYDVDPAKVQMLGTGQWDVKGLGSEPALLGGWYAAPDPTQRADFERQYAEAYGAKPPRLATLAYDAAALAAVLGRGNQPDLFSAQAITQAAGFAGRDGIFRFQPYGLAQRGLAVLSVGQRNPRILNKAPTAFQAQ